MSSVPYVVEESGRGERGYDTFSRLLEDRTIFLDEKVNDVSAGPAVVQFLFFESEDPDEDINLYINNPGDSVTADMAIYDTMQHVKYDVSAIYIGMTTNIGAFLLFGSTKGKRYVLPNAEITIHQPFGGAQGQEMEIHIVVEQISKTRDKLNEVLTANTRKDLKVIVHDTECDSYITAAEAKEYGLIDEVIAHH